MIKKTIKYTDYNGEERIEDFWFNLSKAECMEMEMSIDGGLTEMMAKIIAAKDAPSIVKVFKDLILKSYGEKSADGRRFIKKDKDGNRLADAFAETEAYSNLFIELSTDDNAGAEFFNKVIEGPAVQDN